MYWPDVSGSVLLGCRDEVKLLQRNENAFRDNDRAYFDLFL